MSQMQQFKQINVEQFSVILFSYPQILTTCSMPVNQFCSKIKSLHERQWVCAFNFPDWLGFCQMLYSILYEEIKAKVMYILAQSTPYLLISGH